VVPPDRTTVRPPWRRASMVRRCSSRGRIDLNWATVAYDTTTGRRLWISRHRRGGAPSALRLSQDGSTLFVTGDSYSYEGEYDIATIAYDVTTGAQRWTTRFDATTGDHGAAIGVSSDGSRVFVTGSTVGPDGWFDYATLAYDTATGNRLWVN